VEGESARLLAAARSLGQTLDPSRLLVRVCEQAVRVVDAECADVFLRSSNGVLRMEATFGRPGEAIGTSSIEMGEQAMTVPLQWAGEDRGFLAVQLPDTREPGQTERELLGQFAELAAAALRNASEHAELALAARTDGLTGCLNRAALQDTLRRELERCRRSGQVLSLAIVDLDDFKQVNEEHGHLAGDELLRRVGAALRESVRSYDVVARYGGDEFAIIAIDADESIAVEVAARALEEIGRAGIGATAGVAELRAGDSPTMLIARADHALLHGKQQEGRGTAVRASGRR
jgi:diguanylate cyclase (GGDEF)-like protein